MHRAPSMAFALLVALVALPAAQARPRHHPPHRAKKAAAPAPAPVAIPDLPERYIEKRVGPYDVTLILKPGNLKVHRTANVALDLEKVLDIPDPVTGDRRPMVSGEPYARVEPPAAPEEKRRGRHHEETTAAEPQSFRLWPGDESGQFGFHFTPEVDGLYTVTIVGRDPKGDADEPKTFEVPFRIGVGTFALQTEVSEGAGAVHREARHPVGVSVRAPQVDHLRLAMERIGQRYLDLGDLLRAWPRRGPNVEAAAEARAVASLVASTKGMVPPDRTAAADEFDQLTAQSAQGFQDVATAAEAKGRGNHQREALAAYAGLMPASCNECHAKFRWGVTNDLSQWPKFTEKAWKK